MSEDNSNQAQQSENTESQISRETSTEAYNKIKPKAPSLRNRAFDVIYLSGAEGIHASQLATTMNEMEYSVRPRLRELKLAGQIVQQGKRVNARGSNEVVWVAKEFATQAA